MIWNCVLNAWSPRFGDPHLIGWVTVAGYFIAAILAILILRQSGSRTIALRQDKTLQLWGLIFVMLLLLGANKQLDLQSFLPVFAKCIAKAGGWYADRRAYQTVFVITLAISFLVLSAAGLRYFNNEIRKNPLAIIGLILLLIFIVLRAAAFNHFDGALNHSFYGISLNWILELSGLCFIAMQAILNLTAKHR
ncbi:MAG: hypothetical protein QM488_03900 [Rhizobiaceae bacterium]